MDFSSTDCREINSARPRQKRRLGLSLLGLCRIQRRWVLRENGYGKKPH